jgi:cephalosporin hydroxylase
MSDEFHKASYDSRAWQRTRWLGVPVLKHPNDLVTYQEILWECKPDVLVETGTYAGGSAYFFATVMDLMGRGRVVTVDSYDVAGRPDHPRIEYVKSNSTSKSLVQRLKSELKGQKVMVVLDSDHSAVHVLAEMELYCDLVGVNQYLVVEDTNVNGHPVFPEHGPGPFEACEVFLQRHPEFRQTDRCKKFGLSYFPGGWLVKQ